MIDKDEIVLKPLLDEDIPLFDRWLSKDYIYKWLCPDGEEQREAWLDEVNNRNGKYDFIRHFIVYYRDKKIGYCLFADCFFLKDLEEEGHDFESLYGEQLPVLPSHSPNSPSRIISAKIGLLSES